MAVSIAQIGILGLFSVILQKLFLTSNALKLKPTLLILRGLLRSARFFQLLHDGFSLGSCPDSVYDGYGVFNYLSWNLFVAKP